MPRRSKPVQAAQVEYVVASVDGVLEDAIAFCKHALDLLKKEATDDPKHFLSEAMARKMDRVSGTLAKLTGTQLRLERDAKQRNRKLTREQRKQVAMDFVLGLSPAEQDDWFMELRKRLKGQQAAEKKGASKVLGFDPGADE